MTTPSGSGSPGPAPVGDVGDYGACRPPIHLRHATLDSLDGPRLYRSQSHPHPSAPGPGPAPPPARPQAQDASPAAAAAAAARLSGLAGPLLRRFSSPVAPEEAAPAPRRLYSPVGAPADGGAAGAKDPPGERRNESFAYYVIYALVNSIMCVPGLYGYASVIFSHPVYRPHINALSKLVILSSVVHQSCFTLFSSLPFSIGQVQDAGLIFLSAMSHRIAAAMLAEQGGGAADADDDAVSGILSTTIVLLGLGTASLGAVLILAGRFRLADAVAYLPLPVVGGYLAFIGYFCLEAGVALCIGETIMKPSDWAYLFDERSLILAIPGFGAGMLFTFVSRKCTNEAMLPLSMVVVPVLFYLVLFAKGWSISDARVEGWVGETSPPVPVSDLFDLVDFGKVRWDLVKEIVPTWAGMVFVVSFSSCLDVAAISMDMGEPLDVNNELMTVGVSNFLSGLAGGFTGSYIFSQTIFTYRTGCRSRWIGILVSFSFLAVVISTVNILEVTPLFFLGSTLIFVGFDLLYEWLVEVRHKLLISEYVVLLATLIAIQSFGINAGIGLGIAVAIFDFVRTSASVSSVVRVSRRSLAVWSPQERAYIENHVYNVQYPNIVTLCLSGSVFFGSSLQVLGNILDETGINVSLEEKADISRILSPLPQHSRIDSVRLPTSISPIPVSPGSSILGRQKQERAQQCEMRNIMSPRKPPRFLVLDLSVVCNIDASAARGCFLQLAKMCATRKIVVCAAGANNRIDWIMQTHDTAQHIDIDLLASGLEGPSEKIILFDDLDRALQFCEKTLVSEAPAGALSVRCLEDLAAASGDTRRISLSTAFTHFLGLEPHDAAALIDYEKSGKEFHSETLYKAGDPIFASETNADGFYVVLSGSVGIISGTGLQHIKQRRNVVESGQLSQVFGVGSVFGFVDFILKRPRKSSATVLADSIIAKFHAAALDNLKKENPDLDRIVDKVLLLCSVVQLATKDP